MEELTQRQKGRQGFGSMSKDRQREIASRGGKAAHAKGTAHQWTKDEAREAGRRGGIASRGGQGKRAIESPAGEPSTASPTPASVTR